jgi:hypothetical protein
MGNPSSNSKSLYVARRLNNVLECLATEPGDIRERLATAYDADLRVLNESDIPSEHLGKWRWIMKELTKYGPLYNWNRTRIDVGSVPNTLSRVRNATGTKIAKAIYELYWAVSENDECC